MTSDTLRRPPVIAGLLLVALALLLAAQAAAFAARPATDIETPDRAVGRAGFAYLSGIRTFAAAVLWNRLEPQFHEYYSNRAIPEQTQMLPTMRIVQTLDPNFEAVYSQAAWIVARRGDPQTGVSIARDGVKANPRSGMLRANLAQILLMVDRNRYRDEIRETVDGAMADDITYASPEEEFESYAVFAATYKVLGQPEKEAAARRHMQELEQTGVSVEGGAGHDHDGDGTPDH